MKPMYLLALLLLPGLASAADRGRTAFKTACASCHYARPLPHKGGKAAKRAQPRARADQRTNLVELMSRGTPKQVRAWIAAPHKVRPDTDCDTRLLEPGDVSALLGFLATRAQPPMPSREELLRREMREDAAEFRARHKAHKARQPRTQSTTSPSQGKK